jgi:hypothetical protein
VPSLIVGTVHFSKNKKFNIDSTIETNPAPIYGWGQFLSVSYDSEPVNTNLQIIKDLVRAFKAYLQSRNHIMWRFMIIGISLFKSSDILGIYVKGNRCKRKSPTGLPYMTAGTSF